MTRRMFYRFENVGAEPRMGGAGFGAYLSPDVACIAASAPLNEEGQRRLVELCKARLKAVWSEEQAKFGFRIVFYQDTWLPMSFQVPGEAATLDIDWATANSAGKQKIERDLEYGPHNVDHFRQAFGLITMFACWAEFLEANVLVQQPEAAEG